MEENKTVQNDTQVVEKTAPEANNTTAKQETTGPSPKKPKPKRPVNKRKKQLFLKWKINQVKVG